MTACRLCGASETVGDEDPRRFRSAICECHIDELCPHCNGLYSKFYHKFSCQPMWQWDIKRNEQALVEFIAHQLQLLTERYKAGQSITRCQAKLSYGDRCAYWWSIEIDGYQLCRLHAAKLKCGKIILFADNDNKWLEDVIKFFHKGKGRPRCHS